MGVRYLFQAGQGVSLHAEGTMGQGFVLVWSLAFQPQDSERAGVGFVP